MKLSPLLTVAGLFAAALASADDSYCSGSFKYDRLNRNDTAVLVIDVQVGIINIVRDYEPQKFKASLLAHAALAPLFDLPAIISTSGAKGPNGPGLHEIRDMLPNAPRIDRPGEINAWDNADFRAAVYATGKKQFIIGGISTDVCTGTLALSMREAGFDVFANADASGTWDDKSAQDAKDRMRRAGVQVLSQVTCMTELLRDWRNPPGSGAILQWFDKYVPSYGWLARQHGDAILNGTLVPGEQTILDVQ